MSRHAHPFEAVVDGLIDLFARITLALYVDLRVEGAERLPREGATLIAARHYHFLFDALVLIRHTRPPTHFFVGLDWTHKAWERRGMELLCRMARWPTILRRDEFTLGRGHFDGLSAYKLSEAQPMLRAATRLATNLLREGGTLVIFPEAYTTVDILPTPKDDGTEFLPFRPGFAKLPQLAERDGKTEAPIVPVGFVYELLAGSRRRWGIIARQRWRITLRFGEPRTIAAHATPAEVAALIAEVEREVRALSAPAPSILSPTPTREQRGA